MDVSSVYQKRFSGIENRRNAVWKVLDGYFARYVPDRGTVLDVACGYGEFINNLQIPGICRCACDINPDSRGHLAKEVVFYESPADKLEIADASIDVAFASNFFEHLPDTETVLAVMRNICRMLKPGGRFVVLQPDIRRVGAAFWDFLDHKLPITVPRMEEAASIAGMETERVIARFLPYTMKGGMPSHPFLVRCYLALMPFSGWLLGKQALLVFRKA